MLHFLVISILFNFVKMFKRSYKENIKGEEMEKKKVEKVAKDVERIKSSSANGKRKEGPDARFSPLKARIG